jgi:hypothetical protein
MKKHEGPVSTIKKIDDQYFASMCKEGNINIWQMYTWDVVWQLS